MLNEEWCLIDYDDIIPGRYEVSNLGNVRNIKTGNFLYGCNPVNENGYVRITLRTLNGSRKFPLHRLVAKAFIPGYSKSLEVNHIDGNTLHNWVSNLEYTTRLENARHAAINGLYSSCEDHHGSIFTNKQVMEICELFEQGMSQIDVIRHMGLEDMKHVQTNISRIKCRQSWINISNRYTWENDTIKYKTYPKPVIERMCELLFVEGYKISEIVKRFPEYNPKKIKQVLKKIKQGKLYKDISIKYINKETSSTTIESDVKYYYTDYIDINI